MKMVIAIVVGIIGGLILANVLGFSEAMGAIGGGVVGLYISGNID